jgi:hypothetical protein
MAEEMGDWICSHALVDRCRLEQAFQADQLVLCGPRDRLEEKDGEEHESPSGDAGHSDLPSSPNWVSAAQHGR